MHKNALGREDYRFPALKCRIEPYKLFRYAPRGRVLDLEGIFTYSSAQPKRNPTAYIGYLDLRDEYRMLGLQAPFKNLMRIRCVIPAELTSRSALLSKQNLRLHGRVTINGGDLRSKTFLAESVEATPIIYRSVGVPCFSDFEDMFNLLYSRSPQIHEHGPFFLLASLIGSERRSVYFPDENSGCGVNIGTSTEDMPGKVSSGRITPAMKKNLESFIRKSNIGPINTMSGPLRWNRFIALKQPGILSRNLKTENEIDWNLITDIQGVSQLNSSEFIASDMNLVFEPGLFPGKIRREHMKDLRQTILFAKTTAPLTYSDSIDARIRMKTEEVLKDLAKEVEYAPFLFRYRFEPLCDAFMKGQHLADYMITGEADIQRKDINEFFKKAKDAARNFSWYAEEYIDTQSYSEILDSAKNSIVQDLYKELLIKGGMKKEMMIDYLIEKYGIAHKKAQISVEGLIHADPLIVYKRGDVYVPMP